MFVGTLVFYTRGISPLVILSGLDILSEQQHVCLLIHCSITVLPDPNCFFLGSFSVTFLLREENFLRRLEKDIVHAL